MAVAYGYGRVSTTDQLDSPEIQLQQIRAYYDYKLRKEGYEWGGFVADLGVSGGTPFANRPQGAILSRKLEYGDVVIFSKMDRGFRDTFDMLGNVKVWQDRGVRAVFLDLNVDTGSAMGRFFLTIAAAIATIERERTGERMKEFQRKRKAEGRPRCKPPYGYRHAGPKGKRHFEANPEQRKIGKLIVAMRARDYSWNDIYVRLIHDRVRGPNGKELSYGTIQNWCAGELRLMGREMAKARQEKGGS